MTSEKEEIEKVIRYLRYEQEQMEKLKQKIIEYELEKKKPICEKVKNFFYSCLYLKIKI